MDIQHHDAFLNTIYRVLQTPTFDIKIDQYQEECNKFENWAFITAWNPLPDILSLEENQSRNKKLQQDLDILELKYSLAIGKSEDGNWSEESFFIENCGLKKANELAAKYGQLAFVFGEKEQKATLHYTAF